MDIIEGDTEKVKMEQHIKWFVDIIEGDTEKVRNETAHQMVCGYYRGRY